MKFNPRFRTMLLDLKACVNDMNKHLTRKLKAGGKKWLHATVMTRTHIPTWSGASRATFQKLASELGTSVPIGRLRAPSQVAAGLRHGARSGLRINPRAGKWQFEYISTLPGLIWNEYNPSIPGPWPQPRTGNVRYTPYGFQAKGAAAWLEYAATVSLPNPFNNLKTRKL
jgi:hypothetical protein